MGGGHVWRSRASVRKRAIVAASAAAEERAKPRRRARPAKWLHWARRALPHARAIITTFRAASARRRRVLPVIGRQTTVN